MKKGFSRAFAFILTMSLALPGIVMAEEDKISTVDISGSFNSDIFLKTSVNATKAYDDGAYYYDGDKFSTDIKIDGIDYKLYGDLATKGNDAVKIDTNTEIPVTEAAVKSIYFIAETRAASAVEAEVSVNYTNGSKDTYNITVPAMTDTGSYEANAILVAKSGIRYVPGIVSDVNVYIHGTVIDTSSSVNKNVNIKSVTFNKASADYYVVAISQESFSQSEIEDQTKETIKNVLGKYLPLNYLELYQGQDGASADEAKDLYSALIRQAGAMEEASDENIQTIRTLVEGYDLYNDITGYKQEINEKLGTYPDASTDFSELAETDLTETDYQTLLRIKELYDLYDASDIEKLDGITEGYGIENDVDYNISTEPYEKIVSLINAYEKAAKKTDLRNKIDKNYNTYINKNITDINASELDTISEMIGYFDEAEALGIDFPEYDKAYIRHLYDDYEIAKTSDDYIAIDISSAYNVDTIAKDQEKADSETWYETEDNLNGDKFTADYHGNIARYDQGTQTLYAQEFAFEEVSEYNPLTTITTVTYPFNRTGKVIPFVMPAAGFSARANDALLIKGASSDMYSFEMGGKYTDSIFILIASQRNDKQAVTMTLQYDDGSKEVKSVTVNSNGQCVNEVRGAKNTYPEMVGYITSGDYKNWDMAPTGYIYTDPNKNYTNGMVIFAIPADSTKKLEKASFGSGINDILWYGMAIKPLTSEDAQQRTNDLYQEVVSNGEIDTGDLSKILALSQNYSSGRSRGIYFGGIDDKTMKKINDIAAKYEESLDKETETTSQPGADFKSPVLDLKDNTLYVRGYTPSNSEDKTVTVTVSSPEGKILDAREMRTNQDGYFGASIAIDENDIEKSGYLEIVINGEDFDTPYVNNDVYFPKSEDRADVISGLKNAKSVSEVAAELEKCEEALSLNFIPFVTLMADSAGREALAKRIYDSRSGIETISPSDSDSVKNEKISAIQTLIKQQSVLECIKEKKMDLVTGKNAFLYDDTMNYSSIDKNGATLYEIFNSTVSEEGAKAVFDNISGKNYNKPEDLHKDIAEAIMLSALKYPKAKGVGHVKKALTKENADKIGINIRKYLDLDDTSIADSDIANMNINSIKDVTDYIASLSSSKSNSNQGSSSSSGGGSRNTTTGFVPVDPIADQNKIDEKNAENNKNNPSSIFADMPSSHWAYGPVKALYDKGVINGKGNNKFCPDDPITRAEFIKILCAANGIEAAGSGAAFRDVDPSAWYAPYINAAYENGIVNGISEDEFGVDLPITRQDVCTILFRYAGAENSYEISFSDAQDIAGYAADAVSYLSGLGVISGFPGNTFKPYDKCTRAQAAKILYTFGANRE